MKAYILLTDGCPKYLTPIHEEIEIPSPVQLLQKCDTEDKEGKNTFNISIKKM